MASTAPRAAIVAGLRTPFVKAGSDFAQLDVLELARSVTVELLQRSGLDPRQVDHLIYGNVVRAVQYSNLARELVLAAGLPKQTPAETVTLACASAVQAGVQLSDIDLVEMHEAFAAQVLSRLQKLEPSTFAEFELGRSSAVGRLDPDRMNLRGGSIALGHPFGATGARCVMTLADEIERQSASLGLVSVCAAGGVGAAVVLERL